VLEKRIETQEAVTATRELAFIYGYFMDNGMAAYILVIFLSRPLFFDVFDYLIDFLTGAFHWAFFSAAR
jgi:hypothetical protein